MKYFFLSFLMLLATHALAATTISSSNVSGHWTTSGSPYLIMNNIQIPQGQLLTIDPGVEVIFQGAYKMSVIGVLNAAGTALQPISFHIQDTTGWYIDSIAAGGWGGIEFGSAYTSPTYDTTSIEYWNVSDTKMYDAISVLYRNLIVKNCSFYHCNSYGGSVLSINMDSTQYFELSASDVHDNRSDISIAYINNGATYAHDCKMYNNTSTSDLFKIETGYLHFESNEVYNNTQNFDGTSAIDITLGSGVIYGNKIHNNTSKSVAAITCWNSAVDINRNLVCNNNTIIDTAACSFVQGGGGIRVSVVNATAYCSYLVRNNIIANNHSSLGAGIFVIAADLNTSNNYLPYGATVNIVNNDVINNEAVDAGGIYVGTGVNTFVGIKNNILFNNKSTGTYNSALYPDSVNLYITTADTIAYSNNWVQGPFYSNVFKLSNNINYTLLGDTTTDIISVNPGLTAPTLTQSLTESALTADFSLLYGSPCIDKGNATNAYAGSIDYAGNTRIVGSAIDIGAYEYYNNETNVPSVNLVSEKGMTLYPNPARNILFVSLVAASGNLEIQDISGKQMMEKQVQNTLMSFDLNNIPAGLYFVQWHDGIGSLTVQKFIVR